jgi:hexosaminidase
LPFLQQASTIYGALRGLETFSQLVRFDFEHGVYQLAHTPWAINDTARFPHRGLMIDTSRHYQPIAMVAQVIDAISYAKLNVLHWHMSDSQSFPFESKARPKLWEGAYSVRERYSQEDVKGIVEYARRRAVRVMVEFDMPGHAASWCKGYPEVCPSPSCTQPLNPATPATFALIDALLGECTGRAAGAGIFPEDFIHLGGDEVNTNCWTKTPAIAAWLKVRFAVVSRCCAAAVLLRYRGAVLLPLPTLSAALTHSPNPTRRII